MAKRRVLDGLKLLFLAAVLLIIVALVVAYVLIKLNSKSLKPQNSDSLFIAAVGVHGANSLKSPLGVALGNDKIYATDAGHRRVAVFTKDGQPLFSFQGSSHHGVKGVALVFPYGIGVNSRGEVFVADSATGKIVVFTGNGKVLRQFKVIPRKSVLAKPLALAFDSQDNLYVTDARTGYVYVFNNKDKPIRIIGNGKLNFPNGIAIAKSGDIYVADTNNQQILIFKSSGKLKRRLNKIGSKKTFLPRGLAFDKAGHLLIADTLNSLIIEINKNGRILTVLGGPGSGQKKLRYPNGLAFDGRGRLFIADRGNNRVLVWRH